MVMQNISPMSLEEVFKINSLFPFSGLWLEDFSGLGPVATTAILRLRFFCSNYSFVFHILLTSHAWPWQGTAKSLIFSVFYGFFSKLDEDFSCLHTSSPTSDRFVHGGCIALNMYIKNPFNAFDHFDISEPNFFQIIWNFSTQLRLIALQNVRLFIFWKWNICQFLFGFMWLGYLYGPDSEYFLV